MYRYRIIETNPGTVSQSYMVQSSYDGGEWCKVGERSSLKEAERLYDELIDNNTRHYGYRVIKQHG